MLHAIHELGLELQVIFNKGAVMVLPSASTRHGLAAAAARAGLSPHNVVAVGEAENDHALLQSCECGAAVRTRSARSRTARTSSSRRRRGPRARADEHLLADDLAIAAPRLTRHHLPLGKGNGGDVTIDPYEANLLICGTSGAASPRSRTASSSDCASTVTSTRSSIPRAIRGARARRGARGPKRAAGLRDPRRLKLRRERLATCSASRSRPRGLAQLCGAVRLRTRTGRPHWLVIDEAHHLLRRAGRGRGAAAAGARHALRHGAPGARGPALLAAINTVIAVGEAPARTIRELCEVRRSRRVDDREDRSCRRAGAVRRVGAPEAIVVQIETTRPRARATCASTWRATRPDRAFYFRGADGKLNLKAHNLRTFLSIGDGVDETRGCTTSAAATKRIWGARRSRTRSSPTRSSGSSAIERCSRRRAAPRSAPPSEALTAPADKASGIIDSDGPACNRGYFDDNPSYEANVAAASASCLAGAAHAEIELAGIAGLRGVSETAVGVEDGPEADSQKNTRCSGSRLSVFFNERIGVEAEAGVIPGRAARCCTRLEPHVPRVGRRQFGASARIGRALVFAGAGAQTIFVDDEDAIGTGTSPVRTPGRREVPHRTGFGVRLDARVLLPRAARARASPPTSSSSSDLPRLRLERSAAGEEAAAPPPPPWTRIRQDGIAGAATVRQRGRGQGRLQGRRRLPRQRQRRRRRRRRRDGCVNEPEDKDGFKDDDGCRELDNDEDGVLDANDRCQTEPESRNGYIDDDGCADEVPEKLRLLTGAPQAVAWKPNLAELAPGAAALLDAAAAVLAEVKEVTIEVGVHTDDQPPAKGGKFADNRELSQARAEAVKAYLMGKGLEEGRLLARGYGDSAPLEDPQGLTGSKLNAGRRAKNRRVELKPSFRIDGRAGARAAPAPRALSQFSVSTVTRSSRSGGEAASCAARSRRSCRGAIAGAAREDAIPRGDRSSNRRARYASSAAVASAARPPARRRARTRARAARHAHAADLALHGDDVERPRDDLVAHLLERGLADHQRGAVMLVEPLEPRREVRGVAHRCSSSAPSSRCSRRGRRRSRCRCASRAGRRRLELADARWRAARHARPAGGGG